MVQFLSARIPICNIAGGGGVVGHSSEEWHIEIKYIFQNFVAVFSIETLLIVVALLGANQKRVLQLRQMTQAGRI